MGGAIVIQLGAVLAELIRADRDLGRAADEAWPVVFGWLGLLFAGFALAAWLRRRRPPTWHPRPLPTDRVNRAGRAAAVAFFVAGTLVLLDPDAALRLATGGRATQPALDAFAYDEGFVRYRGPILLAVVLAGIAIQTTLLWLGRWRPTVRTADLVHSLAVCAVLTWVIGSGPIFTAAPTDRSMKGAIAVIILATLIELAWRARRLSVAHALRHR
ncbi:hypothetical protein [Dactylosporangium darangshiense]|uniref:hypothetical protein n=1 Tax=Dactylosporangium darangshiense TaxID=579108 RepID=UPI00362525A7